MFRRIFWAAIVSGVIAGAVLSGMQAVRVIPLIIEAETYETRREAAVAPSEKRSRQGDEGSAGRVGLTLLTNVLTSIGFALLLTGCFSIRGGADWKQGVLWGLGGFASFAVAPSLGLPPQLPGTFAAPVPDRQLWWLWTVASTSAGLLLIVFKAGPLWKILAVFLVASPYIIGSPLPEKPGGPAPEELRRAFVVASILTSFFFWILLGGLAGFFFRRFEAA